MKQVSFPCNERNVSLKAFFDDGEWWFSLPDLAQILGVSKADFPRKAHTSHCRNIDGDIFSNFPEFGRRLHRSRSNWTETAHDWFFKDVFPKLRSMEEEEQFQPMLSRFDQFDTNLRSCQSKVDSLEAIFEEKLNHFASEIHASLLHFVNQNGQTTPPIDVAELREQQQYNNQIVENFIGSLEKNVSLPSLIDPFDDEPYVTPLINSHSNGNGNGNGRKRDEVR